MAVSYPYKDPTIAIILSVILGNAIAARHRSYYESLTDEELSSLVERATGMLVANMEGSR